MKKLVTGAALAAVLMMSATAFAANTTAPGSAQGLSPSATATPVAVSTHPAHQTPLAVRYARDCSSLGAQWSSSSSAHANAHDFHKAEHQAKLGATSCESQKVAELRSGVSHYRSALKIIGVKPTI